MRFAVTLSRREADALLVLAEKQLRDPREQIRLIVRRELLRRRLLEPGRPAPGAGQQPQEVQHAQ